MNHEEFTTQIIFKNDGSAEVTFIRTETGEEELTTGLTFPEGAAFSRLVDAVGQRLAREAEMQEASA